MQKFENFIDTSLLQQILTPYKERCKYLISAKVISQSIQNGPKRLLSLQADFSIPESCYIADTGHFNAVEFGGQAKGNIDVVLRLKKN